MFFGLEVSLPAFLKLAERRVEREANATSRSGEVAPVRGGHARYGFVGSCQAQVVNCCG